MVPPEKTAVLTTLINGERRRTEVSHRTLLASRKRKADSWKYYNGKGKLARSHEEIHLERKNSDCIKVSQRRKVF